MTDDHPHLSRKNIVNAVQCIFVMAPSVLFMFWFVQWTPAPGVALASSWTEWPTALMALWAEPTSFERWASVAYAHPILMANVLFFLNVNVVFYVLGVISGSFWLIDPYWTILPVLIVHFFQLHPLAVPAASGRGALVVSLIWLWSLRLTHSYFRREEWKFGVRQDWRFTQAQEQMGNATWLWVSFFYVFVAQQLMLVGLSLPAYAVFLESGSGFHVLDAVFGATALLGMTIAYFADSQLRAYMQQPTSKKPKVLDTGLWHYSRHPNYFGEQLFWWSFALLGAASVGAAWTLFGTMINSLVLYQVTQMTEQRMVASASRSLAYRQYMRTTSVWLPLPKFSAD